MIELFIILIIVGAVIWLISAAPFLDEFIKKVIYVVAIVFALIYVLRHLPALGL